MKREDICAIAEELAKILTPINEVYLDTKELSTFLRVSESTIRHNKDIPFVKIGNSIRYPKSKVIRYLNNKG